MDNPRLVMYHANASWRAQAKDATGIRLIHLFRRWCNRWGRRCAGRGRWGWQGLLLHGDYVDAQPQPPSDEPSFID